MKTKFYPLLFRKLPRSAMAALLLIGILAGSARLSAASPSELLEKAIYAEETTGDLDAAIQLYQQVVNEAKAVQALAAQAQYRLGQCYQKQMNHAAAAAAFEKLVRDFPDEKELAAKARAYLPGAFALEPVPWADGEVLQLAFKFPSGFRFGIMAYTADQVELGGRQMWRLGNRRAAGAQGFSSVVAEPDSFLPVQSRWFIDLIGEAEAVYRPGSVEITIKETGEVKTIDLAEKVYDNEQAVHLMRRLPLAVGYKATLPIITTLGGGTIIPIGIEVTAKEMVETEAGRFECYKVELNVKQTFWFSTEPHRYLVKMDAGGAAGELSSVRHRRLGEWNQFEDQALGISMAVPWDWFIYKHDTEKGDVKGSVAVLDPSAAMSSHWTLTALEHIQPNDKATVRSWAEISLANESKAFKEFSIRAGSWSERTVAGQPGLSVIADARRGDEKKVIYAVFALGEPVSARFLAEVDAAEFEAIQPKLGAVADSFKMR